MTIESNTNHINLSQASWMNLQYLVKSTEPVKSFESFHTTIVANWKHDNTVEAGNNIDKSKT